MSASGQKQTCAVQLAGFLHRRWNPVRYRRVGHGRSVCLAFDAVRGPI
jgi:hypothetical protein